MRGYKVTPNTRSYPGAAWYETTWGISPEVSFTNLLSQSRQDQEEGGELDYHEKVRLSFAGSGEIKRWCWALKSAQKRSRAGRWSWAQRAGLLLIQLLLNSSAMDIVLVTLLRTAAETAIEWYTSWYAMARGHCLNLTF